MKYKEPTVFRDYSIEWSNGKTSIRAIVDFGGLDKWGFLFYIVLAFVFYNLPYFRITPLPYVNGAVKIFIIIIVFIVLRKICRMWYSLPFLTIDTNKHTMTSVSDKSQDEFQTKLTDIKDISIAEQVIIVSERETILYRLRFTLRGGEKTLIFAFSSYDKLREIVGLIKKSFSYKTSFD